MNESIAPQIDLEADSLLRVIQRIEAGCQCPDEITIIIPSYAIGHANEHLSICEDLLDISYVTEAMAACVSDPSLSMRRQSTSPYRTQFVFNGKDPGPDFLGQLRQSCMHFGGDDPEIAKLYSDYFQNYPETMKRYKDSLDERQFFFPALIDDYHANLINGAYYTYEQSDWVQADLARYPERRFGFHKSAFSARLGADAFASIESWIVSAKIDLGDFFRALNQDVAISQFHSAKLSMLNNVCIATAGDLHVHFPLDGFLKARVCQSFLGDEDQVLRLGWQRPLFSVTPTMLSMREYEPINQTVSGHACLVHESGELIILTDSEEGWHHIFFESRALDMLETKQLGLQVADLSSGIDRALGVSGNHRSNWQSLDDEQFEALCYDLIYSHPGFDHETIRKMGHSRSRDGGRDIIVWTQPVAYREPSKKFVFQCKLITSKRSLGKRDVPDIGDMLEQYGAEGFGIMTSAAIDATLFDAADAICERRNIAQKHFSSFEIERFLNQRPELRRKFFGS